MSTVVSNIDVHRLQCSQICPQWSQNPKSWSYFSNLSMILQNRFLKAIMAHSQKLWCSKMPIGILFRMYYINRNVLTLYIMSIIYFPLRVTSPDSWPPPPHTFKMAAMPLSSTTLFEPTTQIQTITLILLWPLHLKCQRYTFSCPHVPKVFIYKHYICL